MFLRRVPTKGRLVTSPYHLSLAHSRVLLRGLSVATTQLSQNTRLRKEPLQSSVQDEHEHEDSQKLSREVALFRKRVIEGGKPPKGAFYALKACIDTLPQVPTVLTRSARTELEEAFVRLAQSTFHQDHSLVRQGLRMIARLLHTSLEQYAQQILTTTLSRRELDAAFDWLTVLHRTEDFDHAIIPLLWHEILAVLARRRNDTLITSSLDKMVLTSISITQETAQIIIRCLFIPSSTCTSTAPPYEMAIRILSKLKDYKLGYDELTAQHLLDCYQQAGEAETGRLVHSYYVTNFIQHIDEVPISHIHDMLRFLAGREDRHRMVRMIGRLRQAGLDPTDDTLLAVLGDSPTPHELRRWRANLSVTGGPRAGAKVMETLLSVGRSAYRPAVDFYCSEVAIGVRPSPQMVQLAIEALVTGHLMTPPKAFIDEAVAIYQDYVAIIRGPECTQDSARNATIDLQPPTPHTYELLLRALLSGEDDALAHLPVALALLGDMQELHVGFDPHSQRAPGILASLMRVCPTPTEALRVYRLYTLPQDKFAPMPLKEEGYTAILNAFSKLPSWPEGIPSARQYFEIVADMRKTGIPPSSKPYSIILRQLVSLATCAVYAPASERDAIRERIARTITRVHNHLAVSSGFTPDTALWNQLMDAYQRSGCFAEAFRVWDQLVAAGAFDATSVHIVLEACAADQAFKVEIGVYSTMIEAGWSMGLEEWNTFLTRLCQVGQIDEAMKVLCLEMAARQDGVEPDEESVRILFKYAQKTNQETEVRSKVKRFLPKLYHSLPDDLRTGY